MSSQEANDMTQARQSVSTGPGKILRITFDRVPAGIHNRRIDLAEYESSRLVADPERLLGPEVNMLRRLVRLQVSIAGPRPATRRGQENRTVSPQERLAFPKKANRI